MAGTITNVPNRWRYPNTEVNYNPYYKEVSAEDTYYHKLFWQNKDLIRKPILPEEYIILTTDNTINTDVLRSSDNKELLAVLIRVILW